MYASYKLFDPLISSRLIFFLITEYAVLRASPGHGVLCVQPILQPIPGEGCTTVRVQWRGADEAEGGGQDRFVPEPPQSVVGLPAAVS